MYLIFILVALVSVFSIRYVDQNYGLGQVEKEPETIDGIIRAKFTKQEILDTRVGCERDLMEEDTTSNNDYQMIHPFV